MFNLIEPKLLNDNFVFLCISLLQQISIDQLFLNYSMFVFDLQCCSLDPWLGTDGFNCDFAGMMSSALRKTISTLAHNTMCLWVAEHMERLAVVKRGTRC